ncbi:MAG: hypothetical protein Q9216_005456 [Gyalolechia sp. 2 TL-2023]
MALQQQLENPTGPSTDKSTALRLKDTSKNAENEEKEFLLDYKILKMEACDPVLQCISLMKGPTLTSITSETSNLRYQIRAFDVWAFQTCIHDSRCTHVLHEKARQISRDTELGEPRVEGSAAYFRDISQRLGNENEILENGAQVAIEQDNVTIP